MWVSRTEAPPGCAVLTGAGLSPGRMPVFLLRCANLGNRQGWHSADTAMPEVKFPLCPHRCLGCRVASCPQWLSLVSALDTPGLPCLWLRQDYALVPSPGRLSPVCPVQMCLSLRASLARSASEPGAAGGLPWVLWGGRTLHRALLRVLQAAGSDVPPAQGVRSRVGTTQGSEGVPGVGSTGTVGSRFPYKKLLTLQCFSLTRREFLPSLPTVEIVALEKVWVCKKCAVRMSGHCLGQ